MSFAIRRVPSLESEHIANALREELAPVVANFATTAADGKTYQVEYYNLEMITSIGYRVKSPEGVKCTVYTKNYSKKLALDVNRHNAQYAPITVKPYCGAHDRFLIADSTVYHIGASLKDLGKSLFAFSKLVTPAASILAQLP